MKLARSGQRQVVLLSGEPGIGKTRLASYAAHHAHGEGFAVVWGACTEELAVPYEPWIGVCSQLVESAPVELLSAACRAAQGRAWPPRAESRGSRVGACRRRSLLIPETERYLLFNAVAGLLGEVAETVPLCVVLDDLHWADAQSLALLKHLLRTTEQGALQVIVDLPRLGSRQGPSADRGAGRPALACRAYSASPCTASAQTRWRRS